MQHLHYRWAIAELEHAFGVRLLDRHRQGIEPTEYGRALLDCGVAVLDDLRQGVKNRVSRRPYGWGSADWKQPLSGRELCFCRR
jgi:Bacterial regulatory helix-turn-helix protein, lysR family